MNRRAFTIVELLVVIGIVAVLASIMLPALRGARAEARAARCLSNLKQLGVALRLYLNHSNDVMPLAAQMPSLALNDYPRIADVLAEYLDARGVFRCPADDKDYFQREGSSYEYNSRLGGRRVDDSFLSRHWGESKTFVMFDYEPFHGKPGQPGAANYLFADSHAGDLE